MIACQCDTQDNTPVVPEPDPTPVTPDDPPTPPEPPTPEPVKPAPGTYTFVLPDGDYKTSWEAGDAIYLRGSYDPNSVTVTLLQDQISADGKTATVELATVPSPFCAPDYLYAAYPAEAVEVTSPLFDDESTRFLPGYPMLVSYWTSSNSFQFKAATGQVVFSVDANGYDAVIFGGAAREEIRQVYLSVVYSSERPLSTSKSSDGYPFFNFPISESGEYRVYIPANTAFNQGLYVYLKKGDSYKAYNYANAVKLKAGEVLALGDVTAKMEDYDGLAPEEIKMPTIVKQTRYSIPMEKYIDPKDGKEKERPMIPELSGICLTEDGESLWAIGDQGQLGIVTITTDGKVNVEKIHFFDNDLEDVTRDPATGTLYFCQEPAGVYRVPSPYTSYKKLFTVTAASGYGNSGLEGIAWYKDNTFYVGSQTNANLWRFTPEGEQLDLISLKTVKPAVKEIGGLCYDAVNDWLWVTDSEAYMLWVFTGDARTYLGRYKVPAMNNESICIDHAHSCVWVGDDDDDQPHIWRFDMEGLTPEE